MANYWKTNVITLLSESGRLRQCAHLQNITCTLVFSLFADSVDQQLVNLGWLLPQARRVGRSPVVSAGPLQALARGRLRRRGGGRALAKPGGRCGLPGLLLPEVLGRRGLPHHH